MRRSLFQLVVVLFIAAAAYSAFMAYHRIGADRLGVVVDRLDGSVVRIIAGSDGGYALVWQAAVPWRYRVAVLPVQRTSGHTVRMSIPELENLDKDYYDLSQPLRIQYRIQTARFFDLPRLRENAKELDRYVNEVVQTSITREFFPFVSPGYRREELMNQRDALILAAAAVARQKLETHGLELMGIDSAGPLTLPVYRVYQEGLTQAAELRKLDRQAALDLVRLKGRLDQERLETAHWYDRLKGLSTILKDNPDILKYIYIDKMGGNVNVILSSDSTGLPRMLEETDRPVPPLRAKKKPVDNLR